LTTPLASFASGFLNFSLEEIAVPVLGFILGNYSPLRKKPLNFICFSYLTIFSIFAIHHSEISQKPADAFRIFQKSSAAHYASVDFTSFALLLPAA
jgi:hypothetical protein